MPDDYDKTVNALNAGADLPDVRRESHRPTPTLVIAAAMLSMYVITKAAEVWQLVHDVSALLTFAVLIVLAKWARSE